MSHINKYNLGCKDINALKQACKDLGCDFRLTKTGVGMFGSQRVEGAVAAVKLPGWRYEIAVKANGDIYYDHFGSKPYSFKQVGLLVQRANRHAIMAVAEEANAETYWIEKLEDGVEEVVFEIE